MTLRTKLIVITLVIVLFILGLSVFQQRSDPGGESYAGLPVGTPNQVQVTGDVIPTMVGFDPKTVRELPRIFSGTLSPQLRTVLEYVYWESYGIFPCHLGDERSNVVMLTAKPSPQDIEPYEVSKRAIETWQPLVFADMGEFIFPDRTMPAAPGLVDFQELQGVDAKLGAVHFADSDAYIYSDWRINYVFYASSFECLESAMDMIYHYH